MFKHITQLHTYYSSWLSWTPLSHILVNTLQFSVCMPSQCLTGGNNNMGAGLVVEQSHLLIKPQRGCQKIQSVMTLNTNHQCSRLLAVALSCVCHCGLQSAITSQHSAASAHWLNLPQRVRKISLTWVVKCCIIHLDHMMKMAMRSKTWDSNWERNTEFQVSLRMFQCTD